MIPFWYAVCLTFGPAAVGYVSLSVTAGLLLGTIPLQLHVDTRRSWVTELESWRVANRAPLPPVTRRDLAFPLPVTAMDLPSIWDPAGRKHLRAAEAPIVAELHIGGGRHRVGEAPGTDAQRLRWNSPTGQFWAIVEHLGDLDEPCSHCAAPEEGERAHAGCPGCCCPCSDPPPLPEGYEIRCTESSEHEWLAVKHVLRIYAPANIVSFTFDDGQVYTTDPSLEIMSRRPAGAR